ncbi:hypothetical protein SS50377_27261 [Spironucleus salmonicida]|uniref:Uncharacterized protein n=1 Tax=Spironucleus salmonicida TaxID=348837 RepID=V6LU37_9EUKA|nr:hypothetical protein SS50377_27261 [Spironucleus salmonicida]|eukprot:EST44309.1 Hypothetical protein SS50377_15844 [Spironucleus salmonicida]
MQRIQAGEISQIQIPFSLAIVAIDFQDAKLVVQLPQKGYQIENPDQSEKSILNHIFGLKQVIFNEKHREKFSKLADVPSTAKFEAFNGSAKEFVGNFIRQRMQKSCQKPQNEPEQFSITFTKEPKIEFAAKLPKNSYDFKSFMKKNDWKKAVFVFNQNFADVSLAAEKCKCYRVSQTDKNVIAVKLPSKHIDLASFQNYKYKLITE